MKSRNILFLSKSEGSIATAPCCWKCYRYLGQICQNGSISMLRKLLPVPIQECYVGLTVFEFVGQGNTFAMHESAIMYSQGFNIVGLPQSWRPSLKIDVQQVTYEVCLYEYLCIHVNLLRFCQFPCIYAVSCCFSVSKHVFNLMCYLEKYCQDYWLLELLLLLEARRYILISVLRKSVPVPT